MQREPYQIEVLKKTVSTSSNTISLNNVSKKDQKNGSFQNIFLNQVQKKQIYNRIIDLYIQGTPASEITEIILIEYPVLKNSNKPNAYITDYLLTEASNLMIESHSNQFEMIAVNHVFIYESLYRFFKENGITGGEIATLKQKEKLLGLHNDDQLVKVDIETEINETTSSTFGYDVSRLTEEEATRFERYLKIIT